MSNRKISPRCKRRGRESVDRLTDLNVENESDLNIKYTSTPLKKITTNRLQRQSSAPPNYFESEESTDAIKSQTRYLKRRKSSRDIRRERNPTGKKLIADRREKRVRKSRRRESGGADNNEREFHEGLETREKIHFSERSKREKNLRRQDSETPIAELLRNAQENQKIQQTRYEDPSLNLAELTTDTIYVQGKNGFNAVKIGNFRSEKNFGEKLLRPIDVAVRIHGFSKTAMFFCQGLLGGLALAQVVLAPTINTDANILDGINATNYPHLISSIFLFLVTMSLLASMDRIDLGHCDLENLRENFSHHFTTIVTLPLYLAAICLHLGTTIDEQNLVRSLVQRPEVLLNVTRNEENFNNDRQTDTWKYILCIISWFCTTIGPNDDMTSSHLEAMQKYVT